MPLPRSIAIVHLHFHSPGLSFFTFWCYFKNVDILIPFFNETTICYFTKVLWNVVVWTNVENGVLMIVIGTTHFDAMFLTSTSSNWKKQLKLVSQSFVSKMITAAFCKDRTSSDKPRLAIDVQLIVFIQFHTSPSSGECRGDSSPSRTRNTSRFSAITDNSAGTTPRRDQARSEM